MGCSDPLIVGVFGGLGDIGEGESWPELAAFGRGFLSSLLTQIWDKFPPVFPQHWLGPAVGPHCEGSTQRRWASLPISQAVSSWNSNFFCTPGLPGPVSPARLVEEATVWESGCTEPINGAGFGWLKTFHQLLRTSPRDTLSWF